MSEYITKTTYLDYLTCPKNTWLKLHKPELDYLFRPTEFELGLVEQGNLIEKEAQKLFPEGIQVKQSGLEAYHVTQKLMMNKTPSIFQATFIFDGFLARNDVLHYDAVTNNWNLYEVKSQSSLTDHTHGIDYREDASFQAVILQELGIHVDKIYIIHPNKQYMHGDRLDPKEFFLIEDVTAIVKSRHTVTLTNMRQAKNVLFTTDEHQAHCSCIYKGRSSHCPTFAHSHPHVPAYSVHDISHIGASKKKLSSLIDNGIFELEHIPDDLELNEQQRLQISAHKSSKTLINHSAIESELNTLNYPLYFFDYETYPAALPLFNGFKPHQHIPFQFSLHVLLAPTSNDLMHHEYVHELRSDPSLSIIHKLQEYIGDKGTIIVWHKNFEQSRNSELGVRHPQHKEFLENINTRLYDLEDIFKKLYYVHPKFKGRTSIKKILPVLVPELTYESLEIRDGTSAAQKWYQLVYGALSEAEKKQSAENLKRYCGLDSYAMYAIWKKLKEECL